MACTFTPEVTANDSSSMYAQVVGVTKKEVARNPPPPFITSTLQQDASAKLGYSPAATMQYAQQLYEGSETPGGALRSPTPPATDA